MLAKVVAFFSSIGYWVRVGLIAIALLILVLIGYRKTAKLQYKIYLLRAKHSIDKIAAKHNVAVGELAALRERDAEVDSKLSAVEDSLREHVRTHMTAEEIAEKFREIGIRP